MSPKKSDGLSSLPWVLSWDIPWYLMIYHFQTSSYIILAMAKHHRLKWQSPWKYVGTAPKKPKNMIRPKVDGYIVRTWFDAHLWVMWILWTQTLRGEPCGSMRLWCSDCSGGFEGATSGEHPLCGWQVCLEHLWTRNFIHSQVHKNIYIYIVIIIIVIIII